jgi:hypothetical protein
MARSIAHYQVSTLYVEDSLLVPYTYDRFYRHEFAPYANGGSSKKIFLISKMNGLEISGATMS